MTEDNIQRLPRKTSRAAPQYIKRLTQGDDQQIHTDRKIRHARQERQDELIHRELFEEDDEEYFS